MGARPVLVLVCVAFGKSITYSAERSPPNAAFVDFETTKSMVAFLATAPDHSVSKTASVSSLVRPGLAPLTMILGGFKGKLKSARNCDTSVGLMLLSAMM